MLKLVTEGVITILGNICCISLICIRLYRTIDQVEAELAAGARQYANQQAGKFLQTK